MSESIRLTLEVDPALFEELKAIAAEKGLTLEAVCVGALWNRANFGKALGPDSLLEELWDNDEDAVYDDL